MAPPKGKLPRMPCPVCGVSVAYTSKGLCRHRCGTPDLIRCKECGVDKVPEEFYVDRYRPRGRVARCKPCYSAHQSNVGRKKPNRRMRELREGARRRGIEWALTREEFMRFWGLPCYYCGEEEHTNGLDRVDNKRGYVIDNVVSCCGICNSMKSNMTQEEFLRRCKSIVDLQANAAIAKREVVDA